TTNQHSRRVVSSQAAQRRPWLSRPPCRTRSSPGPSRKLPMRNTSAISDETPRNRFGSGSEHHQKGCFAHTELLSSRLLSQMPADWAIKKALFSFFAAISKANRVAVPKEENQDIHERIKFVVRRVRSGC